MENEIYNETEIKQLMLNNEGLKFCAKNWYVNHFIRWNSSRKCFEYITLDEYGTIMDIAVARGIFTYREFILYKDPNSNFDANASAWSA